MAEVRAPMVGKVIEVLVQVGAVFAEDDELLILESMKMEIPVAAPERGVVESIHVHEGDTAPEGSVVARIKA